MYSTSSESILSREKGGREGFLWKLDTVIIELFSGGPLRFLPVFLSYCCILFSFSFLDEYHIVTDKKKYHIVVF